MHFRAVRSTHKSLSSLSIKQKGKIVKISLKFCYVSRKMDDRETKMGCRKRKLEILNWELKTWEQHAHQVLNIHYKARPTNTWGHLPTKFSCKLAMVDQQTFFRIGLSVFALVSLIRLSSIRKLHKPAFISLAVCDGYFGNDSRQTSRFEDGIRHHF
jgi:predicted Fe-S protein YdhL (DUF1289 family)